MHLTLKPDRLYVTVDILILTVKDGKLSLMLSRRLDPPYEGRPALPGRFVGIEESAETAVRRLMEEMLPIPDPFLEAANSLIDPITSLFSCSPTCRVPSFIFFRLA